jgi:hypothetical protein
MTDLATTLVTLAAHIDRIGITQADVVATSMDWTRNYTIHLRDAAASRLVTAHGDMGTHTITDYTVDGVVQSHHHRIAVNGTGGSVILLWITPAAATVDAAQAA